MEYAWPNKNLVKKDRSRKPENKKGTSLPKAAEACMALPTHAAIAEKTDLVAFHAGYQSWSSLIPGIKGSREILRRFKLLVGEFVSVGARELCPCNSHALKFTLIIIQGNYDF